LVHPRCNNFHLQDDVGSTNLTTQPSRSFVGTSTALSYSDSCSRAKPLCPAAGEMSSKPPMSRVPTPPGRQKGQNNAYPSTGIGHSSPNRPLTPNQNHTNVDPSSGMQPAGAYSRSSTKPLAMPAGTVTAGGSERVKVVVRVRPALRVEEEGGAVTSVADDPGKLQLHRPYASCEQDNASPRW
jgi:hypothetical protein